MKRIGKIGVLCVALLAWACSEKEVQADYVVVPEGKLYYEMQGAGEPLIFVHGHSLDSRMWREQVAAFADRYRVVTYDARGYGRSSKQREDLLFTHCDDLVTLMDALGIEKAHLVGLSMGGFIVGDLLAMYPERALTATLCEGHIRSTPSINHPMTDAERQEKQRSIDAVHAEGMEAYKARWFANLMHGGSAAERMREPLWEMVDAWDGWQATHHEVHCYYAREAMDTLRSRQPLVPTLFIEGHRPNREAPRPSEMMRYLPNSRMVVVPDCGHMVNMERPEVFNRELCRFLEEN